MSSNRRDGTIYQSYAEVLKTSPKEEAQINLKQQTQGAEQARQARNVQSLEQYYIMNRYSREYLESIEKNDFKIQMFYNKVIPTIVNPIYDVETEKYTYNCLFQPCLITLRNFNNKNSYYKHIIKIHHEELPGDGAFLLPRIPCFKCLYCDQKFYKSNDLQAHFSSCDATMVTLEEPPSNFFQFNPFVRSESQHLFSNFGNLTINDLDTTIVEMNTVDTPELNLNIDSLINEATASLYNFEHMNDQHGLFDSNHITIGRNEMKRELSSFSVNGSEEKKFKNDPSFCYYEDTDLLNIYGEDENF